MLSKIRTSFREQKSESNSERIREALSLAQSKLSYLKTITPRFPEDDVGAKRYTIKDGRVVELSRNASSTNSSSSQRGVEPGPIDSGSLRRHEALMQRFQFKNRS